MAGGLLAMRKKDFSPGFTIPMLGGEAEGLNISDVFFRNLKSRMQRDYWNAGFHFYIKIGVELLWTSV
jgi:hypothetical protein